MSCACCAAFFLALSHWPLPSSCNGAASGDAPLYRLIRCRLATGNVELGVVGIDELQEFVRAVAQVQRHQSQITPDAVLFVDDRVADAHLGEVAHHRVDIGAPRRFAHAAPDDVRVQLRLGDERELRLRATRSRKRAGRRRATRARCRGQMRRSRRRARDAVHIPRSTAASSRGGRRFPRRSPRARRCAARKRFSAASGSSARRSTCTGGSGPVVSSRRCASVRCARTT